MNPETFQESLAEMIHLHHLPRIQVLDIVEKTMSEVLSSRYRGENVRVHIDEDSLLLDIQAYSSIDGGMFRDISSKTLSGVKNLNRHIETALLRASVLQQVRAVRKHVTEIRPGVITQITSDGTLFVELQAVPNEELIIAECALENQPVSERGHYKCGDERYFHLRNCTPVVVGTTPRCKLVIDRLSKRLTTDLLRMFLRSTGEEYRVTCAARRPGSYSEVWSTKKIPLEIIREVQAELAEQILVFVGKDSKEICRNRNKRQRRKLRLRKQKESDDHYFTQRA